MSDIIKLDSPTTVDDPGAGKSQAQAAFRKPKELQVITALCSVYMGSDCRTTEKVAINESKIFQATQTTHTLGKTSI